MKKTLLLTALLLLTLIASAKQQKVYLFGISTSFTDSLVYVTEVQEVQDAYVENNRAHFLIGRNNYSAQLRDYLAAQGQPHRTCITVWATSRKAAEKKRAKLIARYAPALSTKKKSKKRTIYQLTHLSQADFAYTTVEPDEGTVYVDAVKAEKAARESAPK